MKGLREKMAESIVKSGDELWTLEKYGDGFVQMWYIKDHESYNDPHGREPQYQVWFGQKRTYVGSNKTEAYAEFQSCKDNFMKGE
jgi:hypothetical protein